MSHTAVEMFQQNHKTLIMFRFVTEPRPGKVTEYRDQVFLSTRESNRIQGSGFSYRPGKVTEYRDQGFLIDQGK